MLGHCVVVRAKRLSPLSTCQGVVTGAELPTCQLWHNGRDCNFGPQWSCTCGKQVLRQGTPSEGSARA